MHPGPIPPSSSASTAEHWDAVYASKAVDAVSWYRPRLDRSIQLIDSLGLSVGAPILDVGAGASTLVDDLLDRGFRNLTLLDISERALAVTRARLAGRASKVRWVISDVVSAQLPVSGFALWHDRAVLHFLSGDADRAAYAALARTSVSPGGHALISGFAADGPLKCSNLPVVRASAEDIAATLGSAFRLVRAESEIHHTPWGSEQSFSYALCQRVG